MKSTFYIYSNSIKKAPKGLMVLIVIFILILIPLLLSFAIIAGVLKLTGKIVSGFLPSFKKSSPITIDESGTTIIDITPKNNSLN